MTAGAPAGVRDEPPAGWTGRLRARLLRELPPEKALPDDQPAYVASWIYVFGVATLAAFAYVLLSGLVLALKGPAWWHVSGLGHFVNSTHLWSVELFFFAMVVHLWGKYWMAAWRGRRATTWITGALAFIASIGAAFTGYLVQTNFDAQWIATQARDGLNSVGIGAFFNTLDLGQVLLVHAVVAPFAVAVIAVWHVLQVRRRGVVPPLGLDLDAERGPAAAEPEPETEPAAAASAFDSGDRP